MYSTCNIALKFNRWNTLSTNEKTLRFLNNIQILNFTVKSINNVDSSISVVVVVCNGLVEITDSGGVVVVKSFKNISLISEENISDGEVEFVKRFS